MDAAQVESPSRSGTSRNRLSPFADTLVALINAHANVNWTGRTGTRSERSDRNDVRESAAENNRAGVAVSRLKLLREACFSIVRPD